MGLCLYILVFLGEKEVRDCVGRRLDRNLLGVKEELNWTYGMSISCKIVINFRINTSQPVMDFNSIQPVIG